MEETGVQRSWPLINLVIGVQRPPTCSRGARLACLRVGRSGSSYAFVSSARCPTLGPSCATHHRLEEKRRERAKVGFGKCRWRSVLLAVIRSRLYCTSILDSAGVLRGLTWALLLGFFFSVISAGGVGYRDLDVGRWIERIKREEQRLRLPVGCGAYLDCSH